MYELCDDEDYCIFLHQPFMRDLIGLSGSKKLKLRLNLWKISSCYKIKLKY